MAKFPTEVEESITVAAKREATYDYLWNVLESSNCIEGLERCRRVDEDTYRFEFQEQSAGPARLAVRYTARYQGNGKDEILYESAGSKGDNTEVRGRIALEAKGAKQTRILLRQMVAPDTPIPSLLQRPVRGFVERQAAEAVRRYLVNVKQRLEESKKGRSFP